MGGQPVWDKFRAYEATPIRGYPRSLWRECDRLLVVLANRKLYDSNAKDE